MSQAPAPATFRFRAPPEAPEHLASRLSGIEARSEFEYVAVSVELEGLTDQIAFTNFLQASPAPSEDTLQKVAVTRLAAITRALQLLRLAQLTIQRSLHKQHELEMGRQAAQVCLCSVLCALSLSLYEYVLPVV